MSGGMLHIQKQQSPNHRHLECVRYLLGEDADPFLVDRAHLRTALHCAAAYGHAPVLRALLADDLVVCLTPAYSAEPPGAGLPDIDGPR